ncbi:hypothetical protein MTR67_027768 [Solanum verrucosum]|uniref:Chromo domain-containing protein n=1 Tax=Solanum verrucosum TaxID=315347 RepID=A0AAF0R5A7_SOLVR|nr:hypothetical protein MTR67_027768 [Solanum verrucosum]
MKGVMRFGKKGKLSPWYIGPYRISKKIGKILDRQVRKLRTKEVASCKLLWRNQFVEEATWEAKEDKKKRYPHIFESEEHADQGGTHGHHPRTVGGPTVRPAGPWFVSANSPRTQPEIWPSVDPRPDLRFVGQDTDRGSCPWIDAHKAQLQSRLMVDQHRPSFDARSVGGTLGNHPRTVGGPVVCPVGPRFVSANSPRTHPEIRPSVDPRPDLRSVRQVKDRGSCLWIDVPKAQLQSLLTVDQHGPSFDARSVGLTIGEGSSQLDENYDWVNFRLS